MLFPAPYPALLGDEPRLLQALEAGMAHASAHHGNQVPSRAAISPVAIDDTMNPPDFAHAGIRFGETHFSASLLKVAALYAAFELRRAAAEFVSASGAANAAALFARMRADMSPQIEAAVPAIAQAPGIGREMRLPKYEQIFVTVPLTGGGISVAFTAQFGASMRAMIVNSDNNAAARCVQALGYSWINGALAHGGFFLANGQSGIWLAGTFIGAWPVVQIPSANDGLVAQAMTSFDMGNLCAHIVRGTLVDAASSGEMLALLADSAGPAGPDPSFMDGSRRTVPARSFAVTHTKIGLGPLKNGRMIASEATLVRHQASGRRFLTVWQNVFNDGNSIAAMGAIVEHAIERFIALP